ncbi:MAG: hypothetical protein BAJATHORv1_30334 [Candidatus Thorarchaeota archaeon]|nr:MAG: hypothetical protein BAJATHORv1_30334 [Candidatus Thorarchaeota archaeon]
MPLSYERNHKTNAISLGPTLDRGIGILPEEGIWKELHKHK